MPKLIPASENGTMGRAVVTGDSAFKAPWLPFLPNRGDFFVFLHGDLGEVQVTVWDIETSKARKTFDCSSNVLAVAVSPFLGLVAAGEADVKIAHDYQGYYG